MISDQWDVVVVPFPFSDRAGQKRRPALVLSRAVSNRSGHTIMAMITSAAHSGWPGDVPVQELAAAGLNSPCLVRLKLFTLDNRLVLRRIGRLAAAESKQVATHLKSFLG